MPASLFPTPTASGSSVPNWTLLQTSTPSGVASVTFSGLSGYSKYRVIGQGLTVGTNCALGAQLNGDSGGNYDYFGNYFLNSYPSSVSAINASYYTITIPNGTALTGAFNMDVDHALLLCPKVITSQGAQPTNGMTVHNEGHYKTLLTLTSITILADYSSGLHNFSAGTITLLGAN